MGTPAPDAIRFLVERFDQNPKVSLSGDYEEEQSPKAKTPHGQESIQRQIAATDSQIDTLVYELYGLTAQGVRIVEGEDK